LLRTLGKLDAFGQLELRTVDRRLVPTVTIGKLLAEIDPYAMADWIEASLVRSRQCNRSPYRSWAMRGPTPNPAWPKRDIPHAFQSGRTLKFLGFD
jgi:hypothetical protein